MGKTAKLKNSQQPSKHSRAARRNEPSLSASAFPAPKNSPRSSDFLAPQLSGAIGKRKSQKPLKRKQRLRMEAGKEKASNIKDRTTAKVQESVLKGDRKKTRRKKWEEIEEGISKEIEQKVQRKRRPSTNEEHDVGDSSPVRPPAQDVEKSTD